MIRLLLREFILLLNLDSSFENNSSVEKLALLIAGSGKEKRWSMFLRALRAKYLIIFSVGFDSSPKPPSSGLPKCLGRITTIAAFSFLVAYSYFFQIRGSFGFTYYRKPLRYVIVYLQESPRLDRVSVNSFGCIAKWIGVGLICTGHSCNSNVSCGVPVNFVLLGDREV